MKKVLFILFVLVVLFVSVVPASAKKGIQFNEIEKTIIDIGTDPDWIRIKYLSAEGNWYEKLYNVPENTKIFFLPPHASDASFDDLEIGQIVYNQWC